MRIDPKLQVQTVPEVRVGGRQVCCGQAARLCDAEALFYTALAHNGNCWYHTVENTQAYSAADVLAEGLGDVRLGYGYGVHSMWSHAQTCATEMMRLVDFADLASACRRPTAGDSPIPVLFCSTKSKLAQPGTDAELFIVGPGGKKTLAEAVIPFIGPTPARDAVYCKWLYRNAGSLYLGFRGTYSDIVEKARIEGKRAFGTGQHVMYSCPYEGKAGTNSILHVNDYGREVFQRLFGK